MAKYKPKAAQKVRDYIKAWNDANRANHVQYYEFMNFIFGSQWLDEEAKVFDGYKKIPLTVNKLNPMVNHMIGEQRKNTPQLQAEPDADVDAETAQVREALIKKISLDSHAKIAYQLSYQNAIVGGAGAFYLTPEYENNEDFTQGLKIFHIDDTCKAYWDLGALQPDKTDGRVGGFRVRITRRSLAARFGEKLESKIGDTALDLDDSGTSEVFNMTYNDQKSVTLIYHWEVISKRIKLYQLSNDVVIEESQFSELTKISTDEPDYEGWYLYKNEPVRIENKRTAQRFSVEHSLWAGDYELERTDSPFKHIPVVFVDQNSYRDKYGKQIWRPFFKDARDSQRYINYLRTQMAYLVKISRADQFMVSKKNIQSADTAKAWNDPGVVKSALPYDESPAGNKPERLAPFEISQSLSLQYDTATNDLAQVTGIYDVQMGNQGDVVSGKASDAQVKRGGVNTFITRDALDRAIATAGELINEAIPIIYDTERQITLVLPDRGEQQVTLNQSSDQYGAQIKNDMTKGKYKIRLVPGSSYEGQKSENLQSLELLLQAQPELFALIADLFVENLPMSNTIELKNRLRTIVPKEILEAGKTGETPPPQPKAPDPMIVLKQQELQAKMMQTQLDYQHKMQVLQQKNAELQLKARQSGADMTIEIQKIHAQEEEAKAHFNEMQQKLQAEMARIRLDANKHHADNTLKILTHEPKFLEPKEPANDASGKSAILAS